MKKWFLPVMLFLLLVSAGCSSGASGENKVVVYSPHGEEMLTVLSDLFKEETGITVEFLTMGGAELVDRIRAEKDNPQADVIYGNPSSVFNQLKSEGLLAEYAPSWAGDIDALFKDSENYWYGTIQTPVVLFYNHDMLKPEEAPKDWFDLTDPAYKDQLVFRSTTSAASRATHAALMDYFFQQGTLDEEGWPFFRELDRNIKQYVSDSSLMFQAIARQEGSIGFWTLSGVTDNVTNNNLPLTIVNAESGSPVITDGIAVIAGAKHESPAQKFVDFAGRPDIQARLAQEFNRMPTHPEALQEAPDWMKNFEYKPMNVNWENLAAHSSDWIQYFEDNIRDSSKVEN